MSERTIADGDAERRVRRGRALNAALVGFVGLEATTLIAAVGWLVFELMSARPDSLRSAIALTALCAIAALWLTVTTAGLIRRVNAARGSAITWQVLQIAVAVGAVQGDQPQVAVSWLLLIPALVTIGLAISPSVRARYLPPEDSRT